MNRFKQLGLLVFPLLVCLVAGCETRDYEPLLLKQKIQELEAEMDELRAEISSLKSNGSIAAPSNHEPEVSSSNTADAQTDPISVESDLKASTVAGLTAEEEQVIRDELENSDAFFLVNEAGLATEADLAESRAPNDMLEKLTQFSALKSIALDGTKTDSQTFATLGKIAALESLSIPRSEPSADDFEKLKGLKNLKFLQLQLATLSIDSFKKLSEFPALEQIRCAKTRVVDAHLQHLSNLKTLKAIDLSENTGVSITALESLSACPNLSFLKVYGPEINDEALKVIGKMKSLSVLGLNDTAVTDAGFQHLKDLDLKEIHLFRTQIGDETLKVIAEMPNIVTLNLRDTRLTDKGIESLTKLKKLQRLDLSECNSPGITDASGEHIAKFENLKELNLWSTKFSDKGLEPVIGLKNLTSLNLDNTLVTDEGVIHLDKMPQLTWLHLGSTDITDKVAKVLMGLENLTYLDIKRTGISEDMKYEIDDELSPNGCDIRF